MRTLRRGLCPSDAEVMAVMYRRDGRGAEAPKQLATSN